MNVILISGKAGCGKSEASELFKKHLSNSVITSLSKYIKIFANELLNWNYDDKSKPRAFLQKTGDLLRNQNKDFLLDRMYDDFKIYHEFNIENVIINDIRLQHEIEYFLNKKDLNVITIRINCDASKRNLTIEEQKHHTETELDNYKLFNYTIQNDFNSSLEGQIINILKDVKI